MKAKPKLTVPMKQRTELQSIKRPFYASKILIIKRAYDELLARYSNSNDPIEDAVNSISTFLDREPVVIAEYLSHSEFIGEPTLNHFETHQLPRHFFTEAQKTKRCLVKVLRAEGVSDEEITHIVSKEMGALLTEYHATGRVKFNKAVGDPYVKGKKHGVIAKAHQIKLLWSEKAFTYTAPSPFKPYGKKFSLGKLCQDIAAMGQRLHSLNAYHTEFPQAKMEELEEIVNKLSVAFSVLKAQNPNSTQKTRRAA